MDRIQPEFPTLLRGHGRPPEKIYRSNDSADQIDLVQIEQIRPSQLLAILERTARDNSDIAALDDDPGVAPMVR
jgi:hypothetical protein